MILDIKNARDLLQAMDFKNLFNELGWNLPRSPNALNMVILNTSYALREIAQLAGVIVFEVANPNGPFQMPQPARLFTGKSQTSLMKTC